MHLPAPISNEKFEREYAERSGISLDELRALGLRAYTCKCDYEECHGFQMMSESTYETLKRLHRLSIGKS
jgi:hypothetical protein